MLAIMEEEDTVECMEVELFTRVGAGELASIPTSA